MDEVSLIFKRNHIRVNVNVASKLQALEYLARLAHEVGVVNDMEKTYESMLQREKEFTTGFGDGFAIPHAKCSSISRPGVFVIKPENPVEWDSFDGQPVFTVIGLLTPDGNDGVVHIKLLASLSRKLIDDEFKKKLISSYDEDELFNMVTEALVAFNNE